MNRRVPNGKRRRSTDTISRELGRPDAVTPGPVWQVTSKTPIGAPRPAVEPALDAAEVDAEVAGAAEVVAAAAAPVDPGGVAGVSPVPHPLNSTPPSKPAVSRTGGVRRGVPRRGRRDVRPGTPEIVPPGGHLKPMLPPRCARPFRFRPVRPGSGAGDRAWSAAPRSGP